MIVLHGSWCPLPDRRRGGSFHLWAETEAQPPHPRRGRPARLSATRARPHPRQVSPRQVRVAWEQLAPWVNVRLEESPVVVWLPSAKGRPLPAPELRLLDGDPAAEEGEPVLAAWEVGALSVDGGQALSLLAALPETAADAWAGVTLGAGLRYWSRAAKLALELLARQQYLPGILQQEDGEFTGAWTPRIEQAADRERVTRLAQSMPPVCRAMRPRPRGGKRARVTPANLPSSPELLDSFVAAAVDGAVRRWGRPARQPPRATRGDLARGWREGLLEPLCADGSVPILAGPARRLRALYEQYLSWSGQPGVSAGGTFRICFRLEAPQVDVEAEAPAPPPDFWTVRYFLQALDDPSLLVPAEAVWREAGSTLHYLNRRFEEPQERLLSGLGHASRLCRALERSLETARPSACTMDTTEAYTFLRESAPLLESAGFGVLVPPWWQRRRARAGLRLHVAPSEATTSSGLLGLDSLVRYDWEMSLGGEQLSHAEFLRLAELKVPLVRVRGEWVELRPEDVDAVLRFWRRQAPGGGGTLRDALRLAQTMGQEAGLAPVPITGVSAEGWVEELLQQLSGREPLTPVPQPAGFRGRLRPYQVTGLSWLAFLHRWGLGACLADDMGLGKTIQVLALLLSDREQGPSGQPSLLVCPTSAVGNWQREAARFAPGLRVLVHHGAGRHTGKEFAAEAARHDMVISTYSLLYRDEESLSAVEWDGVILDEAQNIKNPSTRQAQAARRLPARYRAALTGTPVENRLSELWSILHFLNPGYLGGQADFRRRFGLPIERYQDPAALERLKSLVRPFILRRVKTDPLVIQDLPPKLEMPVYYKLTPEQATLYQAVVADAMQQIEEADGVQRRGMVLAMLLKLKQICNHPAQFLRDGSSLAGRSGKLARVTEMLDEVEAAGERALVFTQFAEMGELLRRHLQTQLRREVLFLHGGVPRPQRERMIRRFQEDPEGPPVFVLSLKAGGTALNLMRANHVFHFDRWWNPAVENQATDRAYRIGQTRTVQVHKFVCLGTLEERIAELIESKRELAENVVDSGEGWLTELSTDDLRQLLALQQDAVEELT